MPLKSCRSLGNDNVSFMRWPNWLGGIAMTMMPCARSNMRPRPVMTSASLDLCSELELSSISGTWGHNNRVIGEKINQQDLCVNIFHLGAQCTRAVVAGCTAGLAKLCHSTGSRPMILTSFNVHYLYCNGICAETLYATMFNCRGLLSVLCCVF